MQNLVLDNISLILFLPLWIFLIIMCGRFFSVYVNKKIIYFITLLSSFLGIVICGYALLNIKEPLDFIYPFIKINEFSISYGLRADKLSLMICLLLYVISFAVQIFSISYMKSEDKSYKFFAFLNLFNFGMASLLFSPNLFQLYVFWEFIGIVSYLLIGFDYKNGIKSEASKRVFIINRIGDTALFSGIIITSYYMYSLAGNYNFVTLSIEDFNSISTLLMAYSSTPMFCFVCGLFIIAAMVKSAQFPFYTWLQDAMEAKIPVSALLHSATLVVAGIYLTIRMMPFYTLNLYLMKIILVIGILTTLICSILASIETHPKKVLAYSTSANLGLMFFAIGLGNIKAALALLVVHAFIKSMLFLSLPNEKINGIGYSRYIFFCVNALCLAGILFAGIGAKELIYAGISSRILSILFMFVSFATAYYIVRLAILIYKNNEFTNTCNITKAISYTVLFCGNLTIYLFLRNHYEIAEPYAAAIGGLALAFLIGKHNALEKINQTPKILEKFCNNLLPLIYEWFTNWLNFIENKVFSNYKMILSLSKFSVKFVNWIEDKVMNKSVNIVRDTFKEFSRRDMLLQSGNVQTYNAYAFILVTIIIALEIVGYMLIFG